MTKTEQNLIDAIEQNDYDLALKNFELFQELKSTTDEEAENYFLKIELMKSTSNEEVIEIVEEVKESLFEKEVAEIVEEEEQLPVETRGRKAKDVDRKEIENDLENLINKTLAFNQKVSRNGSGDSRFAKRISRELVNIRKRLVR
ncbi:hypothetical protein COW64_12275 [bacterium (Candidatus Blackallbacteria) CG18_big_fil_WC_8_21_14_2_50_49_26]|nr:MAG: hypothetical protein COW64_12275 [bacterium (Candidatus Blackallbacteria) CG18_big_fil_WC_8_21_14_2_50_49_26]